MLKLVYTGTEPEAMETLHAARRSRPQRVPTKPATTHDR